MLKFRPIVYGDTDLRAFKYTGTSDVAEGQFVTMAASTTLHIMTATPFTGTVNVLATLPTGSAGGSILNTKAYFPIYRENPDPDTVSATISQNNFVVGFNMKSGNEFEVHKTVTESGFASTFTTVGGKVCLGSTGKLTYAAAKNSTGLVVGICLGTFNAAWIRVRAI